MEAEIARLQSALQSSQQDLQSSQQDLQSAQQDIAKKDEELKDLKLVAAITIKNIYTESDASGEVKAKVPPPLTLNNTVTPSLDGHERGGGNSRPG
jgi:chromosome segregation ATPase